jgi:hypothetical protein
MAQESHCDPTAVSEDGAGSIGLMQVTPASWRTTAERLLIPSVNVYWGMRILSGSIELADGDVRLGLAMFNCGEDGVANDRCGRSGGLAYADRVIRTWIPLMAVRLGKTVPPSATPAPTFGPTWTFVPTATRTPTPVFDRVPSRANLGANAPYSLGGNPMHFITLLQEAVLPAGLAILLMAVLTQGLKVVLSWFNIEMTDWGGVLVSALVAAIIVFGNAILAALPPDLANVIVIIMQYIVTFVGGAGAFSGAKLLAGRRATKFDKGV